MEGPSIVILVEECNKLLGKRVIECSGSSKVIDVNALSGQKLLALKSWGKHFLLIFPEVTLKVHFLLFGSYRIDEERAGMTPRLSLKFKTGVINLYSCSIQELTSPLSSLYDWRVDIMSPVWDEEFVVSKIAALDDTLICDALLDQQIFAGVGNIIKNEVLFRLKFHPQVKIASLSESELHLLAREARLYSFQFYIWKKQYQLRKNWQVYRHKNCPVCNSKIQLKALGKLKRRTFFCVKCQKRRLKAPNGKTYDLKVQSKLKELNRQLKSLRQKLPKIISKGQVEREH